MSKILARAHERPNAVGQRFVFLDICGSKKYPKIYNVIKVECCDSECGSVKAGFCNGYMIFGNETEMYDGCACNEEAGSWIKKVSSNVEITEDGNIIELKD